MPHYERSQTHLQPPPTNAWRFHMGWERESLDQGLRHDRPDPRGQEGDNNVDTKGCGRLPRPSMQPCIFPTAKVPRDLVGYAKRPNHSPRSRRQSHFNCKRDAWTMGPRVQAFTANRLSHTQVHNKNEAGTTESNGPALAQKTRPPWPSIHRAPPAANGGGAH